MPVISPFIRKRLCDTGSTFSLVMDKSDLFDLKFQCPECNPVLVERNQETAYSLFQPSVPKKVDGEMLFLGRDFGISLKGQISRLPEQPC